MKKTSINLLCILIICILSGSVLFPAYYLGTTISEGFRAGWEMADRGDNREINFQSVEVYFQPTPECVIAPSDSIVSNDGVRYPMVVRQASVLTPTTSSTSVSLWITGISYVFSLVCCLLFIIEFVKFIMNINRGEVFVSINVKRLRRFSLYLMIMALLNIISGISQELLLSSLSISLEGYAVSAYWTIPWSNLLLALLALLIAQIWSRGIALEEEQQLTV